MNLIVCDPLVMMCDERYWFFFTGGWRTTRPTWQRGPYGRNYQIHLFCTYKHTRRHKLGSVAVGVKLKGSNSDERRKKHILSFGFFFFRGGLEGKATSVNLVLTAWWWALFHIRIVWLNWNYTQICGRTSTFELNLCKWLQWDEAAKSQKVPFHISVNLWWEWRW